MNPVFVQESIQKLLSLFESQDFPAVLTHSIIRRHAGDSRPCDRWSLTNRLLMVLAGTDDARGYRQWLEVGRHVRKGAAAIRIIAPITKKGIRLPENSEEPDRLLVGFCPIAVFALESTEGGPLPQFDYSPPTLPPLWNAAQRLGLDVSYRPFAGRYLGYYQPEQEKIVLASQDAFVFYHELAHAVHHQLDTFRPGMLARSEVVAEMTAAILCHLQGIAGYECSAYSYIARFSQAKSPDAVLQFISGTLAEVERIVLAILDLAETKQTEVIPLLPQTPASACGSR